MLCYILKYKSYIQNELQLSIKNIELIQLSNLEKSLVYFRTPLKSDAATIEKMASNVYYKTGVSEQVFKANSSSAVETSITNDMAFMQNLIDKYALFVTEIVNMLFSNKSHFN